MGRVKQTGIPECCRACFNTPAFSSFSAVDHLSHTHAQFVSEASLRTAEEVFRPEHAAGAPKAETEMEREDRKRRRAAKKRGGKKRRAAQDEERAARAVSLGAWNSHALDFSCLLSITPTRRLHSDFRHLCKDQSSCKGHACV